MAAFAPSNNEPASLVSRELSIASSFVKQYYTMLNRAPQFIHNFYSDRSTFIHGTIEFANDNHTEPIVGRDKISRKMTELNLHDCRAKIKQIDCLETLGGGLVIQVIGELSNNGKPMRRFLQTFVLAPSHDDARNDADLYNQKGDRRYSEKINNASSTTNEKFHVLNSIFRYQDDGQESEFEDDSSSVHANTSVDNSVNTVNSRISKPKILGVPITNLHPNGSGGSECFVEKQSELDGNAIQLVERIADNVEDMSLTGKRLDVDTEKQSLVNEIPSSQMVSRNGASDSGKNCEISEKSIENPKMASTSTPQVSNANLANPSNSVVTSSAQAAASLKNEPKTWASMVRSSQSHPSQLMATQNVQIKTISSSPSTTDQIQSQQNQQPSHGQQQSSVLQIQQQQSQHHQPQHQQQQNKQRSRINRKPSNKVPGSHRATNKIRAPRTALPTGAPVSGAPASKSAA